MVFSMIQHRPQKPTTVVASNNMDSLEEAPIPAYHKPLVLSEDRKIYPLPRFDQKPCHSNMTMEVEFRHQLDQDRHKNPGA
jgi:hypothetical protein